LEHRELTTLDVDLQEVEVLNLGNVVEPPGLQRDALDHFPQRFENPEEAQRHRVRFE
jgi:hypothetical protein